MWGELLKQFSHTAFRHEYDPGERTRKQDNQQQPQRNADTSASSGFLVVFGVKIFFCYSLLPDSLPSSEVFQVSGIFLFQLDVGKFTVEQVKSVVIIV